MWILLIQGDEGSLQTFVSLYDVTILESCHRTDSPAVSLEYSSVVRICISRVTLAEIWIRVKGSLENREILMTWLIVLICIAGRLSYRRCSGGCTVKYI
jgi:hypothetical protein